MGSFTNSAQVHLASLLGNRNEEHGVQHEEKAMRREHIETPGIHQRTYEYRTKEPPFPTIVGTRLYILTLL